MRNGDLNNHIAVHHQLTNHNIDWDSTECLICSTNYFQRPTLESWYTNLEQTPLNRCQQLTTARTKKLTIWLTINGSKPTNDWWQTLHESFSQYDHGLTDQSPLTDQHNIIDWQNNTIHLTLKMTSAQVVETSVTNNSSFQNYPHPDDHTTRTNKYYARLSRNEHCTMEKSKHSLFRPTSTDL